MSFETEGKIPTFGVQAASFSPMIQVGRLSTNGQRFIGDVEDCTSMALNAVANLTVRTYDGKMMVDLDNGDTMAVEVTKAIPQDGE